MAYDASHAQALSLQRGHCPVHILLFAAADDHVGPILSQAPGDGEADPTRAKETRAVKASTTGKEVESTHALCFQTLGFGLWLALYSSASCTSGQGRLNRADRRMSTDRFIMILSFTSVPRTDIAYHRTHD